MTPPPPYAPNVALTVKYLEACNKIFERGFLGNVRIWSGDSIILHNMEEGYRFFCAWIDGLLKKGKHTARMYSYTVICNNVTPPPPPPPLFYAKLGLHMSVMRTSSSSKAHVNNHRLMSPTVEAHEGLIICVALKAKFISSCYDIRQLLQGSTQSTAGPSHF